jgi:hypothetical protein
MLLPRFTNSIRHQNVFGMRQIKIVAGPFVSTHLNQAAFISTQSTRPHQSSSRIAGAGHIAGGLLPGEVCHYALGPELETMSAPAATHKENACALPFRI